MMNTTEERGRRDLVPAAAANDIEALDERPHNETRLCLHKGLKLFSGNRTTALCLRLLVDSVLEGLAEVVMTARARLPERGRGGHWDDEGVSE